MGRKWTKTRDGRWDSDDNAVVKYDHTVECNTAKPWLPNHRGFIAYGPGPSETNYLGFRRKNSRGTIPRKFKTAEAAMKAIDKHFPKL